MKYTELPAITGMLTEVVDLGPQIDAEIAELKNKQKAIITSIESYFKENPVTKFSWFSKDSTYTIKCEETRRGITLVFNHRVSSSTVSYTRRLVLDDLAAYEDIDRELRKLYSTVYLVSTAKELPCIANSPVCAHLAHRDIAENTLVEFAQLLCKYNHSQPKE